MCGVCAGLGSVGGLEPEGGFMGTGTGVGGDRDRWKGAACGAGLEVAEGSGLLGLTGQGSS